MSKGQEEAIANKNRSVILSEQSGHKSSSLSDSSDDGEEEIDEDSALEYILRGDQDLLTSKIMLQSGGGNSCGSGGSGGSNSGVHEGHTKIDPDTQARLEALLEAAGVAKLADGKAFADPDVLRRLTSSVSSALDEAAAALTRMRTQNNGLASTSCNQATDSVGIHSLANACLEGNVTAVRKLLEQGWSVHDSTDEGESLLSLACSAGFCELAQVLLAMNAKVDDRGNKGDCTPLMEAASGGFLDIVHLLLDHGADVNAQSQAGNTALIYACCGGYEDVVKLLLNHGAQIEAHNENGHTPLMEAASGGHVNVAKLLLQQGACINSHSNEFKESALTLACYKGHVDMVKFLLSAGADQEHKTDEMHTALMEASMDGHVEVARLLLDHGAEVNMPADSFESPLTLAACGGHVELASLLIAREAFLEEVNDEGYTPLMEAAREGHLEMVALLLDKGADLHAQTEETQESALSLTCCGGFQDVAAFLLDRGANIEQGSSTPLMEASQEGHVDLVKFLLKKGANVNATTATGDTPLSFACENGHTEVADILLDAGAQLEHESEGGRTSLMKAARAGHLCTVQFLISRGADVNRSTTTNDHTVLSLACAGGYQAVVELLLAHGAQVDHMLKDNSTMLLEACKGGHTSVVRLLLETPRYVKFRRQCPFGSLQPTTIYSSTSPPRVPPVPSLEQVHQNNLPPVNSNSTDTALASSVLDMLPAKMGLVSENLYKSAFMNELAHDDSHLELALANLKNSEITTPPTSFKFDNDHIDNRGNTMTEDLSVENDFISSSLPLTPTPSPASPTFEPAIDIEQQTESNHDTALSLAAAGGHDDLVNLLLLRGAELEHRDKKGCTPLILAATAGHASTVQMLLDHGAEIESQSDRTKDTALSLACSGGRQEVVEVLINNANFEHRNVSDYTPLSLAASGGYIGIVKILLAHGAEINSRTGSKLGISPLMLAAMNGHSATVKLLLDMGADINAQIETNRNTALTLACFQGRHEVVNLLVERKANIEHRAKTGLTPLMEAASGGYVDVGRVLLDRGADVNAPPVPSSRDTALTIAADKGHQKFCDLLLCRGAIVEVRNKKGSTPLWLAANGGHLEVLQLLVRYRSDVNSQDNRKVSVLMAAFRKGHVKTVKWLVRHVTQFPSESDTARFISTLSDKELLKKCQTCMGVIRHAKDRQEAEAEKNASILLEELDMEKAKEKVRKEAAARRREKKKKKKKKHKESSEKNVVREDEEDEEIDKEDMKHDEDIVSTESCLPAEAAAAAAAAVAVTAAAAVAAATNDHKVARVRDTLSNVAVTSSITAAVNEVFVVTTCEMSKVLASSMYMSTSRMMSPVTVATAAAQCVSVTLTTSSSPVMSVTRIKSSPNCRRTRKHEDGWNVVIRRSKKLSVPSSVISRVIGRGGCNVNAIRDVTGAHVDIDTSNQKVTGTCTVTIKGPVEATKQAHHLILTLIKDPECDLNEHLPRSRPSHITSSLHKFDAAAVLAHTTTGQHISNRGVNANVSSGVATSAPHEKRVNSTFTNTSSSILPGNARWASPTYQSPCMISSEPVDIISSNVESTSLDKVISTSSFKSPAVRQLVFSRNTTSIPVSIAAEVMPSNTTSEYRNCKTLSYSKVAGGSIADDEQDSSSTLPPVINDILSQVCQTRSPIVWNGSYQALSRNQNEDIKENDRQTPPVSLTPSPPPPPLTISSSGSLFKPLPTEISPPSAAVVAGTSPVSSSSSPIIDHTPPPPPPPPPPRIMEESSDKPLPIGTERAHHRRSNTSPTLPHATEGCVGQTDSVWGYYTSRTTMTSWPPLHQHMSAVVNSSPRPISAVSCVMPAPQIMSPNSNNKLQEFLETLGLANYLLLFQKNEIDLDALLLMNENDYAEIGLPQIPATKLLDCTRRLRQSMPEAAAAATAATTCEFGGIRNVDYIVPSRMANNYHNFPMPSVRPPVLNSWPEQAATNTTCSLLLPAHSNMLSNNETYNSSRGNTTTWNSWSRTAT